MSNSPMKLDGQYGRFAELIDSDEAFLTDLLASPSQALLAYGFSVQNDGDRASMRSARESILQHARSELKKLKRS
jgi:hypothetical protein